MPALTPQEALRFVSDRGLVDDGPVTTVGALGGGVSNDTLMVEDGRHRVVVKRALGQLRTERAWFSSPRRALDEATALRIVAGLTPRAVPRVLAVDADAATIALTAAPPGWRDWKSLLLAGEVDVAVGQRLGQLLACWHDRTTGQESVHEMLPDLDRMVSLRLDPFHRVICHGHPDLRPRIEQAVHQLLQRRLCLVHGDFSPKNVLVGPGGLWVIDFEVAHVGHPVFDVGFLQAHLLLKGLARPESAVALADTAAAFVRAYAASPWAPEVAELLALHTGCLVLARVDGTSPVDYLDAPTTAAARSLGRDLVTGRADMQSVWAHVGKVAADAEQRDLDERRDGP